MTFDWDFFARYLFHPSSVYLYGLMLTLCISVVSQALGTAIGVIGALAVQSRYRVVRAAVGFYVWLMRGTPLLVQVVFIYTGLAAADIFRFENIDLGLFVLPGNIQAGIIALSLNEGAYMTEIIRAGIRSVDHGQTEAAKSLGMTPLKLMERIVLPQAARVIVPPLGNEFSSMLKNTTLLSVIGVPELLLSTNIVISATFRVFELLAVVSLYYLTLTTLWSLVQRWIDRRLGEPSSMRPASGLGFDLRSFMTGRIFR